MSEIQTTSLEDELEEKVVRETRARLAARAPAIARALLDLALDVVVIAGAVSVSYGAWLAWEPAGYIVGGGMAIVGGLRLAKFTVPPT